MNRYLTNYQIHILMTMFMYFFVSIWEVNDSVSAMWYSTGTVPCTIPSQLNQRWKRQQENCTYIHINCKLIVRAWLCIDLLLQLLCKANIFQKVYTSEISVRTKTESFTADFTYCCWMPHCCNYTKFRAKRWWYLQSCHTNRGVGIWLPVFENGITFFSCSLTIQNHHLYMYRVN